MDTNEEYGTAAYWKNAYDRMLDVANTNAKLCADMSEKYADLLAERNNETLYRLDTSTRKNPFSSSSANENNEVDNNIYSTSDGRGVYVRVNKMVQVIKYLSPVKDDGMVYQISLTGYANRVILDQETTLKVISALEVLMKDSSVKEISPKGPLIVDLKTRRLVE
ncbi:hypothetical protein [Parabacteroides sp. PF5-9]|uniref:hypothetical protein n=1 Tax=Parabacteroides sp. PF5-9 TaxID=1742404 RepID=UPI002472F4AC|nr:hypothetical protein [Parabacteroides sp. PF5-9]MDH6357624.1 putative peptidase [Parabacteroides sp. PF5-9]